MGRLLSNITHLPNPSDAQLLLGLRDNDHQTAHRAFTQLVERHAIRFYRVAFRFLQNQHDAEDMVQTAFLKLWQNPDLWRADKDTKFTTWFYRLLANQCLDELKRHKADALPEEDVLVSDAPGADEILDKIRQQRHVETAIRHLRANDQTALNLCYYEDVSNTEAAAVMGLSLKAFESLLFRAKTHLKDQVLRLYERQEREAHHAAQ